MTGVDSSLHHISRKFLCGSPQVERDLEMVFSELCESENGILQQDALLLLTVDHPLVLKYPLKSDYQRLFLRLLIQKLEQAGVEISDRIYSRYCDLLATVTDKASYRHYCLINSDDVISLKESVNLVSNGTTGLRTWEASHALISWCFHYAHILKGAKLLELGSGIGLSGIAISLLCQPSLYCFSDCHPEVLETLIENIKLNIDDLYPPEPSFLTHFEKRALWAGNIKESKAAVLNLPWEDIPSTDFTQLSPDFILASDIVYDCSIFNVLSSAIYKLAQCGAQIIIASTVRNPETLAQFLECLSSKGLYIYEETLTQTSVLPTTELSTNIKIHRATREKGPLQMEKR